MALEILYEDRDIIVVIKPRGVSSQSNSGFEEDMVSLLKKHIGRDAYIGVVHRLDKPVYGIMVYGKNKNVTAILSEEMRKKKLEKIYEVLVEGRPDKAEGELRDFIIQDKGDNISHRSDKNIQGAREAVLNYKTLLTENEDGMFISRLMIKLITGRHHQIRLQCAAHGFPLFGDYKYNKRLPEGKCKYDKVLTLAAVKLSFLHPVKKVKLEYKINADF